MAARWPRDGSDRDPRRRKREPRRPKIAKTAKMPPRGLKESPKKGGYSQRQPKTGQRKIQDGRQTNAQDKQPIAIPVSVFPLAGGPSPGYFEPSWGHLGAKSFLDAPHPLLNVRLDHRLG